MEKQLKERERELTDKLNNKHQQFKQQQEQRNSNPSMQRPTTPGGGGGGSGGNGGEDEQQQQQGTAAPTGGGGRRSRKNSSSEAAAHSLHLVKDVLSAAHHALSKSPHLGRRLRKTSIEVGSHILPGLRSRRSSADHGVNIKLEMEGPPLVRPDSI